MKITLPVDTGNSYNFSLQPFPIIVQQTFNYHVSNGLILNFQKQQIFDVY